MPRAKKDGQHINCYIDRTLCERLKAYADEKGQTMTMALERILKQYFESENKEAIDKDDMEALCSDDCNHYAKENLYFLFLCWDRNLRFSVRKKRL